MIFRQKYLKITFCLLLLFAIYGNSIGQDPTSQIEKLKIGSIKSSLSLSGSNLGSDIWGRFSKGNYFPWLTVFENPAFISGEQKPKILFQFVPNQTYGLTGISDISNIINDEIDNAIIDYRSDDLEIGYPAMNIQLKRKIQWPEGMILFPVEGFTFGLLFHRAMNVNLNFDLINTEASISTELNSGGSVNKVILNNYIDATNHLNYLVTSSSFFLSKVLKNNWVSGLQMERLYYDLSLKSNINIQGTMYYNGKEYLFNDPNTLWPTDLYQSLVASYSGSAWRMNWGNMVVLKPDFIVDGTISFVSDANLEGELTGDRNKIPALNIDAMESGGGIDEILDAEKLDPSQLTFTESIGWNQYSTLSHTLPNYLKLGFLYRVGSWAFYFSDHIYFGKYKLQYGDDFIELDPKHLLKLYISRGAFYSKLGAYAFSYFAPSNQDFSTNTSTIYLPSLSFGYGRSFFARTFLIGNLDILPVVGVNVGVQYQF